MEVADNLRQELENQEQSRQNFLIESFIDMVKAPDGDFGVLEKLAHAASDEASLQKIVEFLSQHPQGQRAFAQRPRLGHIDLEQLHLWPSNTLGHLYAEHMLKNNLKPLQPQPVDNDYQYLAAHLTETHDIWHIVTGCHTNILGELKLEAFYVQQLYASRFWLSLVAKNLVKAVVYDIEVSANYMDAITQGWMMAKNAKPLFGIQWSNLWSTPIEEIRSSLALAIL